MLRLAPGVFVANAALTYSTARSGGPGGQNVNKTESKVELRFDPNLIEGLSYAARQRLLTLSGQRLTDEGMLVLSCDETRSQRSNRDMVVERLCELVREAMVVPKIRRRTRPGRGAIERRLEEKARTSKRKQDRRSSE
jgi:ribosome-associated protein